MRFEVPQFIDIEDKIFGPLTFKQFIYVAGGGGLCFAIYKLVPIFVAVPLIIGIGLLAWALAFYRLNNQPFINIAQAFVIYLFKGKKYIWKKEIKKNPIPVEQPTVIEIPKNEQELTRQNIEDLARNLDILDRTRYN
jgi:hypothetical protein